jgi:hypothetical protein
VSQRRGRLRCRRCAPCRLCCRYLRELRSRRGAGTSEIAVGADYGEDSGVGVGDGEDYSVVAGGEAAGAGGLGNGGRGDGERGGEC